MDRSSVKAAENDPDCGHLWGPDRSVPSSVIVDVATGRFAAELPLRRIWLRGVRIEGVLDLDGLTVLCPVVFERCHLEAIVARDADLRTVRLHGCKVARNVDARGARVHGSLEMSNGFSARGVSLDTASIDGQLVCSGGRFVSPGGPAVMFSPGAVGVVPAAAAFTARGLEVRGSMRCVQGFNAEGEVVLSSAHIGGDLNCSGGRFANASGRALSANGITVDGAITLGHGFTAEGEVNLLYGRTAHLDCTGGHFTATAGAERPAIVADGLVVNGSVFMRKDRRTGTEFRAVGGVQLTGAKFMGTFGLGGARLIGQGGRPALQADGLEVAGSMFCREDFLAEGAVRLNSAHIGGELTNSGGRMVNRDGDALVAEAANIENGIRCMDGPFAEGNVLLRGARLGRLHILPSERSGACFDLREARIVHVIDNDNTWTGGYELRGLHFETIGRVSTGESSRRWYALDRRRPDVLMRLAWLDGNKSGYEPQIYDELAASYRRAGQDTNARDVLIKKHWRSRKKQPGMSKALNWAQYLVAAYGYRTKQAALWFVAFLVIGAAILNSERADIVQKTPSDHVPTFHSLLYALDLMLPVVNLSQRDNWTSIHAAETVSVALTIVGYVLTIAIVAALSVALVRQSD